MKSLRADVELTEIFETLKNKGLSVQDNDETAAKEIARGSNTISTESRVEFDFGSLFGGPPGMASLVNIHVGHRAYTQKVSNLTWEPDKSLFDLFKNVGLAGLSATGVPLAVQAISGAAALTAPHVLLPIIAVATVAAGLRWSGRVAMPLRAAYLFHHAWKISEYSPQGSEFSVSDLCDDLPTILENYPITDLNESKIQEDLNQLIALSCIELIPVRAGLPDPGFRNRRCRLLEKVRIKKTSKEFL